MGRNTVINRQKKFVLSKTRVWSILFFGEGGTPVQTPLMRGPLFVPITRHGCWTERDLGHSNYKIWMLERVGPCSFHLQDMDVFIPVTRPVHFN